LSACRDNELAYDDNDMGETVTKVSYSLLSIQIRLKYTQFFIEHLGKGCHMFIAEVLSTRDLELNPKASYEDLLSHIQ